MRGLIRFVFGWEGQQTNVRGGRRNAQSVAKSLRFRIGRSYGARRDTRRRKSPPAKVDAVASPALGGVIIGHEVARALGVRAIFAEVSDPGRLAEIVAADAGDIQVVTLYSDALSSEDGPAATYLDYLRYNAGAIISALS